MHWKVEFEQVGQFMSDGDAQTATVIFNLTRDDENLGQCSTTVKVPYSAGTQFASHMEVTRPSYAKGNPKIPNTPFRKAVVAYVEQTNWRLEDEPDPTVIFQTPWATEFDADPEGDDYGW
jgi:hypothetical protein